jgi:hypothetical protein
MPEGLNPQQHRCENLRFHVSALIDQTKRRHIPEEGNFKVTEYTSCSSLLKDGPFLRLICFDLQFLVYVSFWREHGILVDDKYGWAVLT